VMLRLFSISFPCSGSSLTSCYRCEKYAKKLHEKERELYVGHWLNVKKAIKIKTGTAKPCFCLDLVRAQDELGFSDPLAGYVSGSVLEAGSNTTAATLVGCECS
jgi:hypothetical protein